jgi:hypothetical protein
MNCVDSRPQFAQLLQNLIPLVPIIEFQEHPLNGLGSLLGISNDSLSRVEFADLHFRIRQIRKRLAQLQTVIAAWRVSLRLWEADESPPRDRGRDLVECTPTEGGISRTSQRIGNGVCLWDARSSGERARSLSALRAAADMAISLALREHK